MQKRARAVSVDPPIVRVVSQGLIERNGDVVVRASSTVTLILAQKKRILVDTGSRAERPQLLSRLRENDLDPAGVDVVVNTHMHSDHCGCNDLFENAMFCAHRLESPPINYNRISGSMTLAPGVEVVHTPGHSPGSVTVFVDAEKRYGICGDAIPTKANYDTHSPPSIAVDRALAVKSMDAILSTAEVVVPGHDAAFEVRRKK